MKRRNSRMLLTLPGMPGRGPALREGPSDGGPDGGGGGKTGGDGGDGKDGSDPGDDGKNPKITGDLDPDRAARAIASARAGETKARDLLKAEQAKTAAILKAAGLAPDGKEDPAAALTAAAAERDKALTAARDTSIELAVYKVASKPNSGVDATALLDSVGFRNQVADLDPASADFGDKVSAAVKAAVKANPSLAANSAASGASGGEFTGGSGAGQPITEAQLAKMSKPDIAKAYAEGKLAHLL